MESFANKHDVIRAFNLQSRTSELLPEVLPMLEADENWEHLQRITDNKEGLQLLWQKGLEREPKYARLCLTLSRTSLSLTVATDYKTGSEVPQTSRSTLVIEPTSHITLHTVHRYSMHSLGIAEGTEVIHDFRTEFDNTLVGLGYREPSRIELVQFPEFDQEDYLKAS